MQIKWGDTLTAIARRVGSTVSELAKANNIADPNKILAGASLQVPGHTGGSSFQADGPSGASGPGGATGPGATGGARRTASNEPVTGGVTAAELQRIMPNLSSDKAEAYLPHLNRAMQEANINTPQRQSAFLAQLAHESGQLQYMEEIASGAAYEGRSDLGNTQPGDGTRYKGRGPIQLTGRANYAAASKDLGIDLVSNPERAADPDVAFRIATWYWGSRNLNQYADAGNFSQITYRINGGYNGAADREQYYARAQSVLG